MRRDDEAGFTVMEITVASMMLLAALAAMLSSLISVNNTASYQVHRNRALDDLRLTAGIFAKDARHATSIDSATADAITMQTYVNGVLKQVRYRVVTTAGETNLERLEVSGSPRLFVIRLTTSSIFTYDNPDPAKVRLIGLHMETKPQPQHPPVVLGTEVSLRNVQP